MRQISFKGDFDIKRLPYGDLKSISMDMPAQTMDNINKTLPEIQSLVMKQLPSDDRVEFRLYKSLIFGDNRYKIKYIPGEKSREMGLNPVTQECWPRNIGKALNMIKDIANTVNPEPVKRSQIRHILDILG